MGRTAVALAMALAIPLGVMAAAPVSAHPHVWVSVRSTVEYDHGKIVGMRHRWTFDEFYTAMAIQGLDKNGDGKYDRQELSELAQVNIDGLKEFDYFTYAKLGEAAVKLGEPKDYWLEYENNILTLNFTLPLAEPVLADAPGFSFSVYDPSFFIAFDLAKDKPVRIGAGAPAGCTASIGGTPEKSEEKRLEEAFASQLNDAPLPGPASTVTLSCPKS